MADRKRSPWVPILGVLLVLAIAGDIGLYLKQRSDDSTTSTDATAATSTQPSQSASPTPTGTTLTHQSGAFSIVAPDNGWQNDVTTTSTLAKGAPRIIVAPDVAAFNKPDNAIGFSVIDLGKVSMTPDAYLAAYTKPLPGVTCFFSKAQPISFGGFTGKTEERQPCAKSAKYSAYPFVITVVVGQTADGTSVATVAFAKPGDNQARDGAVAALKSFKKLQ